MSNILSGLGFEPEHTGGGCVLLTRYNANGSRIWVSDTNGCDGPTASDWMVCAYPIDWDGGELAFDASSDDGNVTLEAAIALAAQSINGSN